MPKRLARSRRARQGTNVTEHCGGRPLSPTRSDGTPFESNPPEREVANAEMCLLPVCYLGNALLGEW